MKEDAEKNEWRLFDDELELGTLPVLSCGPTSFVRLVLPVRDNLPFP